MSNTPETPTIPDLENCLNVHGIFRCLGIVVSNLKTTHEIAGNYPQTHHKFRKHLAHIRKSRKTGSGQVQIFQVWRWPHLVMSRCNMAKENWNSWNRWKVENFESFQENESPAGNVKANLSCARCGPQLFCSQQLGTACEIDSWQSTDSLMSCLVQFSSNIQGISKVGSIIHKIQV